MTRAVWIPLLVALAVAGLGVSARAQQSDEFTVAEIRIEGLDRVQPSTVLAFVGVERGDSADPGVLDAIVSRLFGTGLFRDIEVAREGNDVVIRVSENPTINRIDFDGMVELDEEQVLELLDSQDIAPGRIFKRGQAEFIAQSIDNFYRQISYYLTSVEVVTVPLEDNRIDLAVEVVEGSPAAVETITIHGATVFDTDDLLDTFETEQAGLIASFLNQNIFSQESFEGDLDRLRRFYLNAGYIRFAILSHDVRIEPEIGGIEIDIYISEGAKYSFAEPEAVGGDGVIDEQTFKDAATYRAGDVFADNLVDSYRTALRRKMREQGHAFATVESQTDIDDENLVVKVVYTLNPDNIAEVRHINFSGNNITQDIVLRRQLELIEGQTFDLDKLEYSLTKLRRTGYLRGASASETRVGEDQVDINIGVTEDSRGAFLIGAGYSNSDGVQFRTDFTRSNILGTGNDLKISAEFEEDEKELDVSFRQEGITDSGISRTIGFKYEDEDDDGNDYSLDTIGGRLSYRIPIDRNWSWTAGFFLERTEINNTDEIDPDVCPINDTDCYETRALEYVTAYGDEQDSLRVLLGLGYDSRDRSFDTTTGLQMDLTTEASVPASDVSYYITRATANYYRQVGDAGVDTFTMRGRAYFGDTYGGDIFPFYRRFFIGSGSLRGFDSAEIGPHDVDNDAIGGLVLLSYTAELDRKTEFLGTENVRVGLFFDSAGLWDSASDMTDNLDQIRASVGALLKIRTPVFPLSFSFALPVLKEDQDELQSFQFRIGF